RPSPATPMPSLRCGELVTAGPLDKFARFFLPYRQSAAVTPCAAAEGNAMTPEENDLLCRVAGDAPMGRIMRRHWIAACLSEEVAQDGAPVRVKLLGDGLVGCRESTARVGV